MNNNEMFFFEDEQPTKKLGPSLVDAFAEFWDGGGGPKHTIIDRKITAAGITPAADVSKERKIVDAFMGATDNQAHVLMCGLLDALRTFSSGQYSQGRLNDTEAGSRLRKAIESAGYSLNEDFELIDSPKQATEIVPRQIHQNENWVETETTPAPQKQPMPGAHISSHEKAEILRAESSKNPPKEVFIVHGHDEMAVLRVSAWVHDLTGVKPIILSNQINRGQTLIEKFEAYSKDAACAIVLMTPDDEARAKRNPTSDLAERARQNVVFELGYFYGKLKRENVIVLNFGVELPGDINGLVYIGEEHWQLDLAKELAGLGYSTNLGS